MKHNIAMEAFATHMRALAISRGALDEPGMSSGEERHGRFRPRRRRDRRRAANR